LGPKRKSLERAETIDNDVVDGARSRQRGRASSADTLKTMSVPALPRTAARTSSLSYSVYWLPSEKWTANFLASDSNDANASVLKD
jgi:hypothetical protein